MCFRTKNCTLTSIYTFQDQHHKLTNIYLFQDQELSININVYTITSINYYFNFSGPKNHINTFLHIESLFFSNADII